MNEIFEDLEFCIEQLGLNDEETEEIVNITENLGIRPEYFADEFVFTTGRSMDEDSLLHDGDYLNIAEFNAMYWEQ